MSLLELLILSVGLAMDAFAVSICKGLSMKKVSWRPMCAAGLWFGGFQALMPLIGYGLGSVFAGFVTRWSHWIAFALLLFLGGKMLIEAGKDEGESDDSMAPFTMFLLAVATSIDALAVGVSLAFLQADLMLSVASIGVITFLFSAAGVKIGSVFGDRFEAAAQRVGGVILVLIGAKILLSGLGVL